jgi:sec-independent protein translocase protein TatA
MPNVGATEALLLLSVIMLLFGAKRLPEMGRSLGRGIREFKNGITGRGEAEEFPVTRNDRAS